MNRLLALLLCSAALTLLPACTRHYQFDKEWRMWAPATPKGARVFPPKKEAPPTPQSPFDGRWQGRWTSDRHHALFSSGASGGELRCILTRIDPYRYRANFRAEWEEIFHGEYLATLYGAQRGKTLHLRASEQVSPLCGGAYRYEGTVTPERLSLRYSSSYDEGTIEMRKVQP